MLRHTNPGGWAAWLLLALLFLFAISVQCEAAAPKDCLVVVGAQWCQDCKLENPAVRAWAARQRLPIVDVDYDRDRELVKKWGIRVVPTYVLIRNGQAVWVRHSVKDFP